MKEVPYRGTKSIRHHPTKFSRKYNPTTEISLPPL